MTQPTRPAHGHAAPDSLPDVYVLSVDYRDGSTTIVRVSTDLDDLLNHYGPDSLSPVLPWEPVSTPFVESADTSLWGTRFASGNDGAHLWIRRMPLHGSTHSVSETTTDAFGSATTDPLADDATRSLAARGILNRLHSAAQPSQSPQPSQPSQLTRSPQLTRSGGCAQCQGENSEQCPRCEFEAEYAADVTALSTLIADGLAAQQTPEKIARTILASEWLDEANERLVTPMIEGTTARLRNQILALIPTDNPELIDAGYTILASDVLDRLNGHGQEQGQGKGGSIGRLDPSLATMSDVEAFREGFFVDVPTISDGALIALMNDHSHLLALAREWGWNETQVRDDFAAVLEARGYPLD